MAKRTMEQVKIGSFPRGKAYGAFIYNLNINIGLQGSPTTIDVDLINETGEYTIGESDLEATSPISITVQAADGEFLKIQSCFLVSYSEEKNTDSSTLKLKYIDGSSVLDKIQVVLLNKQASPANFNIIGLNGMMPTPVGGFDSIWYKSYINPFVSNYTIPISCINKCANTGRPAWSAIVRTDPMTGRKYWPEDPRNPWGRYYANNIPVDLRDFIAGTKNFALRTSPIGPDPITGLPTSLAPGSTVFNASRANLSPTVSYEHDKCALTNINPDNKWLGGAIVIGEEEFVSSTCQLANISYGFADLKLLLENYVGITIDNWGDRGRPDLKESFTGSLREVLDSWASLYGYNYTWDFSKDKIITTDLLNRQEGENILKIKDVIENLAQDTSDPSAALNLNYSTSIEGTYRQDDISTFQRPARKKTIEDKYTRRVLFEPVTLRHIIPYKEAGQPGVTPREVQLWNLLTGGRSSGELILSSVLAKFNKNARTLYNYYLIATKTNGFDPVLMQQYGGLGRPLGLSLKKLLSQEDKDKLLSFTMSAKTYLANNAKYGSDAGMFLGTYSNELEDSWIKWEQGIADFIGKYYIHSNFIPDMEVRNKNMQVCFDRTVETIPQSEIYIKGTDLRHFGPASWPNDERYKSMTNDLPFKDLLRHPGGATFNLTHPDTKVPLNEFRLFSRNPNYGFNEEDVENLFYHEAEDVLKDYIPSYAEVTAQQGAHLKDLIDDAFPDIKGPLSEIENETKKPMLFFFPAAKRITEAMVIPQPGLRGKAGWELVEKWGDSAAFLTRQNIIGATEEDLVQVWNDREYQPKTKEGESIPCELFCDFDLTSFLCDCPDGDSYGYSPDKVGLTSLGSRFFDLQLPNAKKFGRFVLPSEYPYSAFFRVTDKMEKTEQGIKQNYGFLNNANNTMGYRVNVRDITSDMETLDNEQNLGSGKTGGNVEQGSEGQGQIKTHVLINKFDEETGQTGKLMEARDFHNLTDTSYTNALPNKQLSFEIVGLDSDRLKIDIAGQDVSIINPVFGLSSLGVTYGEGGLIMSFSYQTRPPFIPNVDRLLQRVGPKLNYNSYLRTY